jgi:eukaryotic-like serine/threonine-protein kinase
VAALNHPNICTLHDVGPNYLVMELVDGQTLAERIQQGAIPLEDAIRIARQIDEALEAAHEKGIIHRDLKPGNVKLKADGTVKVLDFGLAKIADGQAEARMMDSPTLTIGATQAGLILGTAAYMAPEQARGKVVDKRADIWAFGVVLFEMLTGRRLFQGEDVSETLASVIKQEPQWDLVPVKVRRLLQSCLERDPKRRLRDIGDAWRLLDETSQLRKESARPWLAWATAALFAILSALAFWAPWRTPISTPERIRFQNRAA